MSVPEEREPPPISWPASVPLWDHGHLGLSERGGPSLAPWQGAQVGSWCPRVAPGSLPSPSLLAVQLGSPRGHTADRTQWGAAGVGRRSDLCFLPALSSGRPPLLRGMKFKSATPGAHGPSAFVLRFYSVNCSPQTTHIPLKLFAYQLLKQQNPCTISSQSLKTFLKGGENCLNSLLVITTFGGAEPAGEAGRRAAEERDHCAPRRDPGQTQACPPSPRVAAPLPAGPQGPPGSAKVNTTQTKAEPFSTSTR